jgi:hypothetical protein
VKALAVKVAPMLATTAALAWVVPAWLQPAVAAPEGRLESELLRCRAIADSLARITCYDAITLPRADAARPAVAAAAPTTAAPRASTGASQASAAQATAASDPSGDFGLPERAAVQALQFIDSALQGPFDGWAPRTRVQLANGQVWEIADGSTGVYSPAHSPKVRISRGMLGSFFMAIEGVPQTPRVRRVH